MEQTLKKRRGTFVGGIAPQRLLAWGVAATASYGFALWGVRAYQNQTVGLGGQLATAFLQGLLLPALLYSAERLLRQPVDAAALVGGVLFAQIPRYAADAGSAWLYAALLPPCSGAAAPLHETVQAGAWAAVGSVTVLCGVWSTVWSYLALRHAAHEKGLRSVAIYAVCHIAAAMLLAVVMQVLRHRWLLNW